MRLVLDAVYQREISAIIVPLKAMQHKAETMDWSRVVISPACEVDQNEIVTKPVLLDVEPEPAEMFMARPKERRFTCEKYLQFVRSLPCVVSGHTDKNEAHHLIGHGHSGMASKTHDLFTFPLSHNAHMELHRIGWKAWEAKHGSQVDHVFRTLTRALGLGALK